jgi:hypothetical protein
MTAEGQRSTAVPEGQMSLTRLLARAGVETGADSIKRFPGCGGCHHVQAAAEQLVAEEQLRADEPNH